MFVCTRPCACNHVAYLKGSTQFGSDHIKRWRPQGPWCCAGSVRLAAEHQKCNIAAFHPDWQLILDAVFVIVAQFDRISKVMLRLCDHIQLGKLILRLVPNTGVF